MKSSDKIGYEIVKIENARNVIIYGLRVEGDRYWRLNPGNEKGEWGMGLVIKSSENVKIYNPIITKCWGDGIYIGRGDIEKPNKNVLIFQAIIDDNRRNGISIICGRDIEIIEPWGQDYSSFYNLFIRRYHIPDHGVFKNRIVLLDGWGTNATFRSNIIVVHHFSG